MRILLVLICAVCLTACDKKITPQPIVPAPLLKPVGVTCAVGDSEVYLGRCAIALRQGLNLANSQINAIAGLLQSTPR